MVSERIRSAIFVVLFMSVYSLLNLVVLSLYARLLGISTDHIFANYIFYLLLAVLTVSFVFAQALVLRVTTSLTKGLFYAAATWMGILFFSFCILLAYFVIDSITSVTNAITAFIVILIVLVLTTYSIFNAFNVVIKEINIHTDKDSHVRIALLTDLHIGIVNGKEYLDKIIGMVNAAKPDLVVITGDLIDGRNRHDEQVFTTLDNIKSDVYFITGNHENYVGLDHVDRLLKNTKVRWLRDEAVDSHGVQIIGLDYSEDSDKVKIMLESLEINGKLDTKKYRIMLYHRPTGWMDAARSGKIDLMLSGHTHAGQIWPFTYIAWLEGKAVHGIYKMDTAKSASKGGDNNNGNTRDFMLYVSPGSGVWGPPMRLGSHTEITIISIGS